MRSFNYIAAFFSSLFASFIYSFWQSAVEAEVYNPAVLMILVSVFFCLVWWDKIDEKNDDRYVMLVIYITLLSIGIHMAFTFSFTSCHRFLYSCCLEKIL